MQGHRVRPVALGVLRVRMRFHEQPRHAHRHRRPRQHRHEFALAAAGAALSARQLHRVRGVENDRRTGVAHDGQRAASRALSITFFMSPGARNWPFLMFTGLPLTAQARMKSVWRHRNAGVCSTSTTSATSGTSSSVCTSVSTGTPTWRRTSDRMRSPSSRHGLALDHAGAGNQEHRVLQPDIEAGELHRTSWVPGQTAAQPAFAPMPAAKACAAAAAAHPPRGQPAGLTPPPSRGQHRCGPAGRPAPPR